MAGEVSSYGRRWIEGIVWLLTAATVLLVIIVGYAFLSGCSVQERADIVHEAAREAASAAVRATIDGIADRFHIPEFPKFPKFPEPKASVSPVQGLIGGVVMMVFYLIRKKLFPMKAR